MIMATKHPIVLIDGSSYLFRAYHALPPLTNSKGKPTGAIYGVINMLKRHQKEYDTPYIAVVFDPKGKTFRHALYDQYKANRPDMPDDLRDQIAPLFDLIKAMGFPLIIKEGVEADDVIGTLALLAEKENHPCIISTGDKDMAQLVNQHISLVNTMSETTLDTNGVKEKYGVLPEQMIDYLALMGDASDNIPGVPKVGPKTAAKWLANYGTLESIIEHADEFKGKVGDNLRDSLAQLPLSKTLTTIKCDVDVNLQISDLSMQAANQDKLITLLKALEFKSWLKEQLDAQSTNQDKQTHDDKATTQNNETEKVNYQIILTKTALTKWLDKIKQCKVFAFDTETTSLNYMQARIVGVSLACEPGEAAYIPFAHHYLGAPQQLSEQTVLGALKPFLEDPDYRIIGQNIKYDMEVLKNHGIALNGIDFDCMLASYVLNSSGSRHDMDTLALKYLGHATIHFEAVAGKGKNQKTFDEVDLDDAGPYACEDADVTLKLRNTLQAELKEHDSLMHVFKEIELPLIPVLSSIERHGVLIDRDLLAEQSQHITKRLADIETRVFEEAGESFNLSSPKQLQNILFAKLGLPIISKTPKGQPSTAEAVLQELAIEYELPDLILTHRSLSKLKSTYTDKLPQQIEPSTGRIHTSYHQAVTATGRLSSSDPNLQNIPIRTEQGRLIRKAFIAPKGSVILAADYSQVELRIMAHLSGDKQLLKAFAEGLDVHRATAAEVFDTDFDAVTSEQRRRAKAINFGLIYGMSAFGLAKQLKIERTEAQTYVDVYFKRYPGVKAYMDNTRHLAHQQGFVETLYGRRLYLPEINARNKMRQQAAERTAINAPMQGTAADIIKRAMITIHNKLPKTNLSARMIMQVHDELVFEVTKEEAAELESFVRDNMMQAGNALSVALLVDVGIGQNWDEAH